MEAVGNDTTDVIENIETSPEEKKTLWNGREVTFFPYNRSYKAVGPGDDPWRRKRDYNPNWPGSSRCGICNHEVVDFF